MQHFANALKDVSLPIPDGMKAWHGQSVEKRFAVYRNNIYAGLVDALAAQFPVTQQIVDDEFFRDMALLFTRANLPTSPTLFTYGANFAQFITHFAPAREIPYLADMARFEYAWVESYHAAEAQPISTEALANVAPELMGGIAFTSHPSTQLLASPYPIADMWVDHKNNSVGARDYHAGKYVCLLVRPQADVMVIPIPHDAFAFVDALLDGLPLADAMALIPETAAPELPATMLATLLGQGCIIDYIVHT